MAEDPSNTVAPIEETVPVAESEIVDMPNAPVTENSTPKIIEAESTPVAPTTPTEPSVPTEPKLPPSDPDIITVRTEETGDKVYAVRAQKRYWIKNPETLAKMGFYLGKEKKLPFSELLGYPEGEPIDLTIPATVYPWEKPETPVSNEPTPQSKIWQ